MARFLDWILGSWKRFAVLMLILVSIAVTSAVFAANLTGTYSASNTPKSNEGPAQAFDGNTNTKWLGGVTASTWLQVQLASPAAVSAYSITSANDAPERDPKNVVLEGSNDGTVWQAINTRTFAFTARFQKMTQTFTQPSQSYTRYRLRIVANNGSREVIASGTTGLVQLSEFELVKAETPTIPTPNPPTDPVYSGSRQVNWTPPMQNTDGTPAVVSGFKVYYGEGSPDNINRVVTVPNPAATSTVIGDLTNGTWYFRVTVYTTVTVNGATVTSESMPSQVVSGVVTGSVVVNPTPPTGPKVVAVVDGLNMSPVYGISSAGARQETVLGFVPIGKLCTGSPVFTYRGRSYYRYNVTADVVPWQSTVTQNSAVACAAE
jgi:hypothetical protein